jgi:UDP-N-acetylglucosamine diphosphorylase/glucosamine-1-phosphate N-acetyltransferase
VYWRTVFELRCGRKTLLDRVAHYLNAPIGGLWTRGAWAEVAGERFQVPVNAPPPPDAVLINGRWLFDGPFEFHAGPFVGTVGERIAYVACDAGLADRLTPTDLLDAGRCAELLGNVEHGPVEACMIEHVWDLINHNVKALEADWTGDRAIEGKVSSSALLLEPDSIHVAIRAHVSPTAVIDAQPGPVYVAEGARISPQTTIIGPAYIGPGTVVNPHCYIHGGTTIGPLCKVGGEIGACIIAGYSNKQHSGFLGHSYVGSWVNLGAGTTNSNLKNTYGSVRVPVNGREVDTGMMFFGSVIGDHAKLGVQQTMSTGASIGFAAMATRGGILPKFVPSFSWITDAGQAEGDPERLLATARHVMQRRDVTCSDAEARLFLELAATAAEWESSGAA